MKRRSARAVAIVGLTVASWGCGQSGGTGEARERAYRANNIGVALLEQLKYPEAAAAFREALARDAGLAIAHVNLSLALMYGQDLDAARREAEEAARLLPSTLQPLYVLGLLARAQNRNDDARGFFERVRQIDASDAGASVNVAQIALEDRRYDAAIAALRPIVAKEPSHVTAAYVLGLALTRSGEAVEGQRLLERAQTLRQTDYAVTFGTGYLEQGRYAEAIASSGLEADLVDPATSSAHFTPLSIAGSPGGGPTPPSPFGRRFSPGDLDGAGARALAGALGGGVALIDVDGDGDLDLVDVSAAGQRLLRNEGGRAPRADVTAGSGLEAVPAGAVPIGAVSADYDNDGWADVFVVRYGGGSLYRNDGNGRFVDVTRAAGLPAFPYLPGAAAFVDIDHDGDVDLAIAGLADLDATRIGRAAGGAAFPRDFAPAPLQLLRNNGNGTFTDITRESRLDRAGHAIAIVPTDFDNHRDIDLLVVYRDAPPVLFANQRDGTFRDVAADVGLNAVTTESDEIAAVSAGDINKDDSPDFFFARRSGGVFAMSDGRGRFMLTPAPGAPAAEASQLLDYDNDGLLDLLIWTDGQPRVLRNLGRTGRTGQAGLEWRDVSAQAVSASGSGAPASSRTVSVADLDRDGSLDVVTRGAGGSWVWQNSGDDRHRSLRVELHGRVSNRLGVGAKIEARAGSLSARLETSAATPAVSPADFVFGLGSRPGADVVRVLWPSGILQAEAPAGVASGEAPTLPSPFRIDELDRKPSSCPFLFTWNGERFEFVTDFLGGGEMGDWTGPGTYNRPDPIEYVRIRGDQLRPLNGGLDVRITNELEETLFLDHVQLMAVAHPSSVDVFPNEGMTDPPKRHRVYAVRDMRVPVRVNDEHGHDVTARVARLDRRYPDDFTLSPIRGYAATHVLDIELGPDRPASGVLLLTGWTDYAFSSDNVAASHAGLSSAPPTLEARSVAGAWRPIDAAVGIPVGRPQTIPVDLTGRLRPGEHELRLTTNMRIYWDEIRVGTAAPQRLAQSMTLDPRTATLRARGFSAEVRPDGHEPAVYDYARVAAESPWKAMAGSFTREGDVLPLVTHADDRFVIARSGDEIALEFDARQLAPLPQGWTRTYLLRGDGFSKEMDPNSASPYTVGPMPFHRMPRYPYSAAERRADSPDDIRYRETYNTRVVVRPLPPLKGSDR